MLCYHRSHLVSGQRQSYNRNDTSKCPQLDFIHRPPKMKLLFILTLGIIGARSKPVSEDYEDLSFNNDEFQYFYNLELVQELTTGIKESKTQGVEDSNNSTRVDDALDKLEEEGEIVEKVLNEIAYNKKELKEAEKGEVDFSASILYEIFYWIFLASFLLMLGLSVVMTGKYFIENPKNGSPIGTPTHRRADLDFDFFPARR